MLIFILIIMLIYALILRIILLKNTKQKTYYREIPSNDSSAYVGKIIKGNINGNDIISTILELSYKGYIRIEKEDNKRVLYLQKDYKIIDLKEHELFLVKQIFKNNNKIIFEDYIKSSKFKTDFKTFDKMLDRRIEIKKKYKKSNIKNISKIILLTIFSILGISIFYSIIMPIINVTLSLDINIKIIISLISSSIVHLLIINKYISYITKSTNVQENINLNITYIFLFVIIACISEFCGVKNILSIFKLEVIWYKLIINFIVSIITLLYMFNIIKHTEKQESIFYIFLLISIVSIILDIKLSMCISSIFFATYIFLKSLKYYNYNLLEEDYVYKWISFKNYLEDYSMLFEEEENAMLIWEKYLIYAIALGVNKKIIRKYMNLSKTILITNENLKKFYITYLE